VGEPAGILLKRLQRVAAKAPRTGNAYGTGAFIIYFSPLYFVLYDLPLHENVDAPDFLADANVLSKSLPAADRPTGFFFGKLSVEMGDGGGVIVGGVIFTAGDDVLSLGPNLSARKS